MSGIAQPTRRLLATQWGSAPPPRWSIRRQPIAGPSRLAHATRRHPADFPFKPPPIRQRLRPLIPFFIWWSIITSLTVHLMRARQSGTEAQSRSEAKISVLESLLHRTRAGERLSEDEVQRQLEMVGLRERRRRGDEDGDGLHRGEQREEVRNVGWQEAIFGRLKRDRSAEEKVVEELDVAEWAKSGRSENKP